MTYADIQITTAEAADILRSMYSMEGLCTALPGEVDFNFKAETTSGTYILKVSRPDVDLEYLDFQSRILSHLEQKRLDMPLPKIIEPLTGATFTDNQGHTRQVRLLTWVEGRLYAHTGIRSAELQSSLGKCVAQLTLALEDFDHPLAHRVFEWDIAQLLWVEAHLDKFDIDERALIERVLAQYHKHRDIYNRLPRSVVHNDANENNIIISDNMLRPTVQSIIDMGDTIHSYTITDLAVAITYAVMDHKRPVAAAWPIIEAYHSVRPIHDDELQILGHAICSRLAISLTKAAINRYLEPDNSYLQISAAPGWRLLRQWLDVDPAYVYYSFRHACGMSPCPAAEAFVLWARQQHLSWQSMLPDSAHLVPQHLDLSIDSEVLGHYMHYLNSEKYTEAIDLLIRTGHMPVGGYCEPRPIYTTDAYRVELDSGYEHRTIHIGLDFWVDAGHRVCALIAGTVHSVYHNDHHKDYGPTIILRHEAQGVTFFTLYGHLSLSSLNMIRVGDVIRAGDTIAYIGDASENGHWGPHLHFQIILDMLDCTYDFYGVVAPSDLAIWQSICPDPNLLFEIAALQAPAYHDTASIIDYRKTHLGRSLSLSYHQPLHIVRGLGAYLIDHQGQQYIDTVNNVAHVGHEHPHVIDRAKRQMHLLNTNTRYLNKQITHYVEALLRKFPPELSVVHIVNSGSEANELALRMAKAYTGQRDIIALELGYHGNTQACIDISSYKFDGRGGHGKPEYTEIVPLPDTFRGLHRGDDAGARYAEYIPQAIERIHARGRDLSAFIAESVVSCGGQIPLPKGYLKAAYEYTRAAGGVCIADEVQVGFGRVGTHFWGYEQSDVIPDIVTLGKPIGNGHPLGAIVCTRAVADAFANGMEYFNTFGGNPVSCAIGNAVLEIIDSDHLQLHALKLGTLLTTELQRLAIRYPIISDIRGTGLFLGIEFIDGDYRPVPQLVSHIVERMKDHRILMSIDGPYHNVIKIKPPMVITEADIRYIIACMDQVLAEIS
jgi:4-aminobutyrate aminotransferase-like enzyme/Ser/Thr protein kinase RdoA (MazF antagonist)